MKTTTLIGADRLESTHGANSAMEKSRATWASLAHRKAPQRAYRPVGGYGQLKGQGVRNPSYAALTCAIFISANGVEIISQKGVPTIRAKEGVMSLRIRELLGDSAFGHWVKNGFIDSDGSLLDQGMVKLTTRARSGTDGYLPDPKLVGAFCDLIAGRGSVDLSDYFPWLAPTIIAAKSEPVAQ